MKLVRQTSILLGVGLLNLACQSSMTGTAMVPPTQPPYQPVVAPGNETTASTQVAESEPMKLGEADKPSTTPEGGPTLSGNPTTASSSKEPTIPIKLVSGNPNRKQIALTFDDGPHRGFTEGLIQTLKQLNVKATFFLIGRNVDAAPELAKAAFDAGIELANHTYTHSRMSLLSDEEIKHELLKGQESIAKATGFKPTYYRPPGGEYDDRVIRITKELGLTMVLWTSDAGDYTTTAGNPTEEDVKRKVLKSVKNGGIVIMHDPMPSTLRALPSIITSLRAQGFEFVTVSELGRDPLAVTKGGPRIVPNKQASVQALVDDPRYPWAKSTEVKNESSQQGNTGTTAPKGEKGQGIDPNSKGGSKGKQGSKIKPQDREAN